MAFKTEKTQKTPSVVIDTERGVFEISGSVYPENASKFFKPIFEHVDDYLKNPLKETVLNLHFIYFNTASSKLIYEFVKRFNEARFKTKVMINWIYDDDDEDMQDTGEEYERFFPELTFNYIAEEP